MRINEIQSKLNYYPLSCFTLSDLRRIENIHTDYGLGDEEKIEVLTRILLEVEMRYHKLPDYLKHKPVVALEEPG